MLTSSVKLYADIFGGSIDFRTVDAFGTDMYLRLPTVRMRVER